jgi:hypothetical protein
MNVDEAILLIRKRWPDLHSSATEEPVFVFAAGWRSGSTLLQRMLLSQCMVWGEPYGSSGLIERLVQPLCRFAPNWPQPEFFVTSPHWGSRLGEQWTANLYPAIQHLLDAHVAFFRTLLAEPSRQRGFARWGLKEVRYGIEHALYFHWLFPKARFLFLIRNPFECWASYRRAQSNVLRVWPEDFIQTPEQFGQHWLKLAKGFCERHREVGSMLIRYESLKAADFDAKPLETHLGFKVDPIAQKVVLGASPPGSVSMEEMQRLQATVAPLAGRLGYMNPQETSSRQVIDKPS